MIIRVPGVNGLGKTKGTRDVGRDVVKALGDLREKLKFEESHVNNDDLEEQERLIYKNSKSVFDSGERAIFIGGDHSISYPIVRAFLESWHESTKLIVFDAHPDLMPAMREPTHEEWLRALIEKKYIGVENVLIVGVRATDKEEDKFILNNKINAITSGSVEINVDKVIDRIGRFLGKKDFYVSFDVDVFDNSIVKATGYAEGGGLTRKSVFKILEFLRAKGDNWRAMDLVEINADFNRSDYNDTVNIGADVLRKFIN